MKMKKIVGGDKRNRYRVGYVEEAMLNRDIDEDDDVDDPVNSSVATDDNDEDAHQRLHSRSTVKAK
uniref:Uncharacterized protein n=1 Tax=Oryza sativa subsp. japonica TaxID=39947 RepID=Q5Z4I4_ORYSJ|nr:hypothetical protein [Oryza sativa Japonica Group]BAD62348.1 hypothetical protein [Oryza sativa Japonica Group]